MPARHELRKSDPRDGGRRARIRRVRRMRVVELAVSGADRLLDAVYLACEPERQRVAPRGTLIRNRIEVGAVGGRVEFREQHDLPFSENETARMVIAGSTPDVVEHPHAARPLEDRQDQSRLADAKLRDAAGLQPAAWIVVT